MADLSQKQFTGQIKCGHCQNKVRMEIVTEHSEVQSHEEQDFQWDAGWVYQVAKCPACSGITFRRYGYHDALDPGDYEFQCLFPHGGKPLRGLPPRIHAGFEAAQRVRNIDANAYGVLLGRVLDAVCVDRQASGATLDQRLKSLADKGEIPSKLVKVAAGIRKLRNIGAHADLGELTESDLPVLDELTRAILEYVYTAPLLATEAEERFAKLKASGKSESAKTSGPGSPEGTELQETVTRKKSEK
jgi:hypothetical protein